MYTNFYTDCNKKLMVKATMTNDNNNDNRHINETHLLSQKELTFFGAFKNFMDR